jgi:hypothetical protein
MSTNENTPVTPPPPANPAKGKNRGQKTLAAKIDRWKRLGTNLALHIDELALFKDQFLQFQAMLAEAQALSSLLDASRADTDDLMARRSRMLTAGEDLFARLSLALRAVHGPQAGRLREFGLKPHRPGRPRKKSPSVPVTPPPNPNPAPEATTGPAAEPHSARPATAAGDPAKLQ